MSELLDRFMEGNLIVDCRTDKVAYRDLMRYLEHHTNMTWAGGASRPTLVKLDTSEPYIWAYRWRNWDPETGIHAMTKMSDPQVGWNVNPTAALVTVQELLDDIFPSRKLQAIENDLLLEVLMS